MTRWRASAALGTALTALGGAALACGEGLGDQAQRIENAQFQLVYRTTPAPIPLGRHFAIDFEVCPRAPSALPGEVRVDATMPEHKHGMNYLPSVADRGRGLYRAEGLMFHMPGRWQLVFELRVAGAAPVRLAQMLQIE